MAPPPSLLSCNPKILLYFLLLTSSPLGALAVNITSTMAGHQDPENIVPASPIGPRPVRVPCIREDLDRSQGWVFESISNHRRSAPHYPPHLWDLVTFPSLLSFGSAVMSSVATWLEDTGGDSRVCHYVTLGGLDAFAGGLWHRFLNLLLVC